MTSVTWHRFVPTSEDDNYCRNDGCGVIVSDETLNTYAELCPAPLCNDPSNDGSPCVMVHGEHGPVCAYCERAGCHVDDDEDDIDEDAE